MSAMQCDKCYDEGRTGYNVSTEQGVPGEDVGSQGRPPEKLLN